MRWAYYTCFCLLCVCTGYAAGCQDDDPETDIDENIQYTAKYRSYLPVNQRQYPDASQDRKPRKKGFKNEW